MLDNEKMLYEGFIRDIYKFHDVPDVSKFRDSKNHINNCLEVAYYLKGRDITRVGDSILVNTPDTIKISPPRNQRMDLPFIKCEEEYEIIDIGIITPRSFTDKSIVLDVSGYPKIKELFLKIYSIWSAKYDNYYFDAMSTYYQIIKEIYCLLHLCKAPDIKNSKLDCAIKFIKSNFCDKNFSYDDLPQMCGWKHSYFYKAFEKHMHTTPQKFIVSLRMQLAVDLLFENKLSIPEIADRCGFESAAYFSRVFKNYYGMPPSRYNQKL